MIESPRDASSNSTLPDSTPLALISRTCLPVCHYMNVSSGSKKSRLRTVSLSEFEYLWSQPAVSMPWCMMESITITSACFDLA